uniref:Uncharacterized protein n=1 Tax=Craspedostauros australis TaxID=1486917 RepID=A0A7R9WW29_9STRA|mmetsp:Transcript_20403/g.56769  ORF Transcript_20403/g.56769 Transcript_20403/m.56769 type:complete len:209 (+) Transcript_20403:116-742(+)|eukprot:CAMPEP_0198115230 /NCGR_PEP_ID=MMETSP1442-20131203/6396_1 /TAXON_ID= /ORGANISM="Craspedostauros australis, Strain CCMP3328" /LENGTH=208 /DNA_ID=CAMNT_0043772705 /DNA_START=91 /DNA_END=717 /DNA_ORIENTATION=+
MAKKTTKTAAVAAKAAAKASTPPATTTMTAEPSVTPQQQQQQPPSDDDGKHLHNLYNGAKGAWAWGKNLAVVGGAFGIAEGVAQAALGVVGTNLQNIDQTIIEPKVVQPLDSLTAPAVNAVVGIVLKTTDTVVPPVQKILDGLISALHLKRILGQEEAAPAPSTDGSATTTTTKTTTTNTTTKTALGSKAQQAADAAAPAAVLNTAGN